MKKVFSFVLSFILLVNVFSQIAFANGERFIVSTEHKSIINIDQPYEDDAQSSGLIYHYSLGISREGNTTLYISAETVCDMDVVKSGFKGLKVERRQNSNSSWSSYYSYGNVYQDSWIANFEEELTVDPGYQYRVICKHYAKKNILNTQTISNTSNIVTF